MPMVFMLVIPAWAMGGQIFTGTGAELAWVDREEWLLVLVGGVILLLECWMIIEAILYWPSIRSTGCAS
jgi:hypothetical protein